MLNVDYLEEACRLLGHEMAMPAILRELEEWWNKPTPHPIKPLKQLLWPFFLEEIGDLRFYGLQHGTRNTYRQGCKGELCRWANRVAQQQAREVDHPTTYKQRRRRAYFDEDEIWERWRGLALEIYFTHMSNPWDKKKNISYRELKRTIDRISGAAQERRELRSRMRLIGGALELAR